MSASLFLLFAVAGLAAVMFLAVLGMMTLLTNPKTRDFAKILLGGMATLILLFFLVGLVSGLFHGRSRLGGERVISGEMNTARVQVLGEDLSSDHPGSPATIELDADVEADSPKPATKSADDTASDAELLALPPDPRERSKVEEATSSDLSEPTDAKAAPEAAESMADEEASDKPATTPEEPEESNVGELSVAPLSMDDRPQWVDCKPYKEGSVYYWPAATDPRPDVDRAETEALPEALNAAVADYIAAKLRLGSRASRQIHLNSEYVRDRLVGEDTWIEHRNSSVGEVVRIHALVKFDREANAVIREAWDHERLAKRLWSAGGFLAVILLSLSLIYCYLKIDQVTDGSRRGLLRFAAILVILVFMLVAALVVSVGIA